MKYQLIFHLIFVTITKGLNVQEYKMWIILYLAFIGVSEEKTESHGSQMVFRNGKWSFNGEFELLRLSTILFKIFVSELRYQWKDTITVGDGKPLDNNLLMSETYRLRFEAFFRTDQRTDWRTLFHGTDGGTFSQHRCGGRLPGIWILKSSINTSIRRA